MAKKKKKESRKVTFHRKGSHVKSREARKNVVISRYNYSPKRVKKGGGEEGRRGEQRFSLLGSVKFIPQISGRP